MDNRAPLLTVERLTKIFLVQGVNFGHKQQLYALDDVSIQLRRGETLGIIGESGCGKSTLSRCIVSLHKPTSGKILLDGQDISSMGRDERRAMHRKIQMIFHDPYSSLNPRKTVAQIVMEPFQIHNIQPEGMSRLDRTLELIQAVGLDQYHLHRYPYEFSGGQRQRINIARALTLSPEILVCDEPVSALDVSMQAQVLNLLIRIQQEFHLTYLFISHDLSVIRYISDHIAVMYLGQIVEMCPAGDIYAHPLHPYTKALLSAIPSNSPFEKKQQIELKGDIPSPIGRQPGCPLASRCQHCTGRCREERPPLKTVDGRHAVACFLYD